MGMALVFQVFVSKQVSITKHEYVGQLVEQSWMTVVAQSSMCMGATPMWLNKVPDEK